LFSFLSSFNLLSFGQQLSFFSEHLVLVLPAHKHSSDDKLILHDPSSFVEFFVLFVFFFPLVDWLFGEIGRSRDFQILHNEGALHCLWIAYSKIQHTTGGRFKSAFYQEETPK